MSTVLLGSESPKAPAEGVQATVNGETPQSNTNAQLPNRTMVIIDTPDIDAEGNKVPLDKKLLEIRNAFALHSNVNAAWVEGADERFTGSVSEVFDCPVGRPSDWDEQGTTQDQPDSEESNEPEKAETQVETNLEGNNGVIN